TNFANAGLPHGHDLGRLPTDSTDPPLRSQERLAPAPPAGPRFPLTLEPLPVGARCSTEQRHLHPLMATLAQGSGIAGVMIPPVPARQSCGAALCQNHEVSRWR